MTSNVKRGRRRRVRALPLPVFLLLLAVAVVLGLARAAEAVPGQSRGVVMLPGNGACSVGGTHDGTYYITVNTSACQGDTIGIYLPPPTGAGPAVLVSTKTLPVTVSAVDWDRSRNLLWGVFGSTGGQAYLINLGDKTMSGPATATLQFSYNIPGLSLIDGLAWDPTDDTLWISPDVDSSVHHFSTTGTHLGAIQPKNAAGVADGLVSGVAIGAANTLYIGRNGTGEIRRVSKADGTFVSTFATANFRVEDLVCALHPQPVGGPIEAILAKGAHTSDYEAFEVEPGTCPPPQQEQCPPDDDDDDGGDDDNGRGDDDDGDDDGVDDDDERNILGLLLNDSDSDDDGINDGNDDGNGNGEDDEDEDDDDECPDDDDSDGDGEDDEDEDDDDDDD
jgi:hypothetical protein